MRFVARPANKYQNVKVTDAEGNKFDSKKEQKRYYGLQVMENLGVISELRRQVKFDLIPSLKINGRTERKIVYIADFTYKDENGNLVVEDCKGFQTDVYKIKKRLMKWLHNIDIKET